MSIRLVTLDGHVIADIEQMRLTVRKRTEAASVLGALDVGDRLLIDRDVYEVVGRSYYSMFASLTVNGETMAANAGQRTTLTVVRRRPSMGQRLRASVDTFRSKVTE